MACSIVFYRIPDPELPAPLHPGEFSSPSIERYFSSLAHLGTESRPSISENFEPIPDPQLDGGFCLAKSYQESHNLSNGLWPTKSDEPQKNDSTGKSKTFEIRMSLDQSMESSALKKVTEHREGDSFFNNNSNIAENLNHSPDDDTLTQVTSVVSAGTSLTERLKRFGIEKPFQSTTKSRDLMSDVSRDIELQQEEARSSFKANNVRKVSADQVFQSFISTHDNSDNQVDSVDIRGDFNAHEIKSDKSPENFERFFEPTNIISNAAASDVVMGIPPMMSNKNDTSSKKKKQVKESFKICPECGQYNKAFLTWCKECGVMLEGEDPIRIHSSSSSSRNSRRSSETSTATIPVEALEEDEGTRSGTESKTHGLRDESEKLCSGDTNTNDISNKRHHAQPVRSAQSPQPSSSGFQSSINRKSGGNKRQLKESEDGMLKYSILNRRENTLTNESSQGLQFQSPQDSVEGAFLRGAFDSVQSSTIRDSANFEYEQQQNPSLLLPPSLKAELSIELGESGSNLASRKQQTEQNSNLVELSEQIDFEYKKADSPTKALPEDLQAELSLDLLGCLGGSNTSAMLAQKMDKEKAMGQQKAVYISQQNVHFDVPQMEVRDAPDGAVGEDGLEVGNVFHDVAVGPGGDADRQAIDDALEVYEDAEDDDDNAEVAQKQVYQTFLKKLAEDPRFKTKSKSDTKGNLSNLQPSQSHGRPKSAGAHGNNRPKSAVNKAKASMEGDPYSKVKASLETEPYQRHWQRSSIAWDSYHHHEVKDRSEIPPEALRSSAVKVGTRPLSAVNHSSKDVTASSASGSLRKSSSTSKSSSRSRPFTAGPKSR